jgi:hypothetical protein
MNYITQTLSSTDCYVYEHAPSTASVGVERKWIEEVLPHFYAPSSRQRVLEAVSIPPSRLADEEVGLESPPFTPPELNDFAAQGFVRRNRWTASGPKR